MVRTCLLYLSSGCAVTRGDRRSAGSEVKKNKYAISNEDISTAPHQRPICGGSLMMHLVGD
jgi:hypothetical protein